MQTVAIKGIFVFDFNTARMCPTGSITVQCGLSGGKQILTILRSSMQVTKGTWRMREQSVPGSFSSSPAQEPGNKGRYNSEGKFTKP